MGPAIIVTDLALKFTHIYHTSKRWNTNYILNIPHSVCNQKVIKKNKKAFKKKLQILQKLSQKWNLHTKKIHLQITLMLVAHFMNLVWKDAILPKHHSVQLYNYANTNKMKKPQKQNLVVGKLMHLAIYTCLDIAFTISKLSQFNSNPSTLHSQSEKHILRYIQGIIDHGIWFSSSDHIKPLRFSDASFATDPDDEPLGMHSC